MALLTGPRNTLRYGNLLRKDPLGVEANTTLHLGGMVAADANGYAVPAQVFGSSPLNAMVVLGIAMHILDGAAGQDCINVAGANMIPSPPNLGSAGAVSMVIGKGMFALDNDGTITIANVGAPCFCADDHTVSLGDGSYATQINSEAKTIPASGPLVVATAQKPIQASSLVVKNNAETTTYVYGTDYFIIDAANGIIGFMGATLVAGTGVHLFYKYGNTTKPNAGLISRVDGDGVWVDFAAKFAVAV